MNQLEQLKQYTTVVADTGEIDLIKQYTPEDATTNPSLVLKASQNKQYKYLIKDAIEYANSIGGSIDDKITNASDRVAINIGTEILKFVPGRISTEVDARLSFNTKATIEKAKKIIALYKEKGIDKSRILIKIASTWEGIKAAEVLEQEGINCNLTLLFSFAQARACAEAGAFLISPFVGRIFDWYKNKDLIKDTNALNDPGVVSVTNIYNYYKTYNYKTIVMGASFRNKEQILALTGCDRLTIAPNLLDELQKSEEPIIKVLNSNTQIQEKPSKMTEAEFRWQHNQDAMAVEKLAEGIRNFAIDQEKLEKMLKEQI